MKKALFLFSLILLAFSTASSLDPIKVAIVNTGSAAVDVQVKLSDYTTGTAVIKYTGPIVSLTPNGSGIIIADVSDNSSTDWSDIEPSEVNSHYVLDVYVNFNLYAQYRLDQQILNQSLGGSLDNNGNLVPAISGVSSIGSDENRWKDAFVSGNTLHIGPSGGMTGGTEMTLSYNSATNTGSVSVDGAENVKLNAAGTTITGNLIVDPTGANKSLIVGDDNLDYNSTNPTIERKLYYDGSNAAFRVGNIDKNVWDVANVGLNSIAMGSNPLASGISSFSIGNATEATAYGALAMGFLAKSTGFFTNAIGNGVIADDASSIALGMNNDATITGEILTVGNGVDDDNRSNALEIYKNGEVVIPAPGTLAINSLAGTGTRNISVNPTGQIVISENTVNSDSTLTGNGTTATPLGIDLSSTNTWIGEQTFDGDIIGNSTSGILTINSLVSQDIGSQKTAFGKNALADNTGAIVSAFGSASALENEGSVVVAIGISAASENKADNVTVLGYLVGFGNQGEELIAIGNSAAFQNEGQRLISIGHFAGTFNTGEEVIIIGNQSGQSNNKENVILIGNSLNATANNQVILGNSNVTETQIRGGRLMDLAGNGTKLLQIDNNGKIGLGNGGGAFTSAGGITKGNSFSDDFLFGTNTITHNSGTEYKFFFDKGKGAFRTGGVSGAQWEGDSLGLKSFASGINPIAKGENSVSMGYYTEANGESSIALGRAAKADGQYSVALGNNSTATGNYSTAMGALTNANGQYSTAMGRNTTATGDNSTSMGYETKATAVSSVAMGYNTEATSQYGLAVGKYNAPDVSHIFVVGNGTGDLDRKNAFVVTNGGNITMGNADGNYHTVNGAMNINTVLDANGSTGSVAVHFSATAPTDPVTGSLWYDSTNSILKIWNGSAWLDI